jgi:hypothetical protein
MNWIVIQILQLDLGAHHQVIEKEIKDNIKNGEEYVKIT